MLAACGGDSSRPLLAGNGRPVILISIDSLRHDHCTPWGYQPQFTQEDTTPFLAKMAREGVVWENALAASSWTLPSHVSLLTGMSVLEHKVRSRGLRLAPTTENIAGPFRRAGWETGGFYSAPFLHPSWGYGQGFDTYEGAAPYLNSLETMTAITEIGSGLIQKVHDTADSDRETAAPVVDRALAWLAEGKRYERPFFLFLHFWDPHYDYLPPADYVDRFHPGYEGSITGAGFYSSDSVLEGEDLAHILALYDAEIRYTDDQIARLWEQLENWGLADQVILGLTSDHGDEFWEHGQKGHHKTLFEEVLRVPMVLRAPGLAPAGKRIQGTAANYDLAPTLLDLAELEGWPARRGKSLRPQWAEKDQDRPILADLLHPGRGQFLHAWRQGNHKILFSWNQDDPWLAVFDLGADPNETHPTYLAGEAENPWAGKALKAFRQAKAGGPKPAKMVESQAMSASLNQLGYTDLEPED